jgi:hypothetical protein
MIELAPITGRNEKGGIENDERIHNSAKHSAKN